MGGKLLLVVYAVLVAGVVGARAEPADSAEERLPRPDAAVDRFVDGDGCAFLKAVVDGTVIWVQTAKDPRPSCEARRLPAAATET